MARDSFLYNLQKKEVHTTYAPLIYIQSQIRNFYARIELNFRYVDTSPHHLE